MKLLTFVSVLVSGFVLPGAELKVEGVADITEKVLAWLNNTKR